MSVILNSIKDFEGLTQGQLLKLVIPNTDINKFIIFDKFIGSNTQSFTFSAYYFDKTEFYLDFNLRMSDSGQTFVVNTISPKFGVIARGSRVQCFISSRKEAHVNGILEM